ncbi:cellulose biosynthesis cyclic di-GMP-binding regulatory protein BcsB [Maribius pontilimi]|uniref:Cyclic di-GMP-binding protein n=1 Tax=Palleronia pontilimi TaxID=1964209 RepID=A0A934IIM5_9RHOB|nr:cellulose biosynthesis cyclic di-GMP-binding regulatory protein BcsB [Palleronia pontilimi]MBJ3763618.1 cellulose biosynthesis cyclic di-GMP-binding regulatory protein BcsB [Palleronia pontilimi]
MSARPGRIALAGLAALALCGTALAQDDQVIVIPSFGATDAGSPPGQPILDAPLDPLGQGAGRLERTRAAQDGGGATDPRGPILAPLLSPLPILPGHKTLRLQGEYPSAEFSLFLPQGQPPGALILDHDSGIAVLPERSVMEVFVNDVSMGEFTLGKAPGDAPDTVGVPATAWQAGFNTVRLAMKQVHRIYCGPDAAFDLWTDIDLSNSGALIDAPSQSSGPADFLAAVARDAADGNPVELRDPAGISIWARPVLDAVALQLGKLVGGHTLSYTDSPVWDVAQLGGAAGASHARITLIPATVGGAATPFSQAEFRRAGDGAEVLVLHVDTSQGDLDRVEADLTGVLEGLMAGAGATARRTTGVSIGAETALRAGEPVRLDRIGLDTVTTSSHYFSRPQVFTLPRDWLILTAQKAILHLDYAYARNLPENSQLLIKVNGETVRLLPLEDEGGKPIEQFPVKFQADLLKEGPNLLQFEAMIPGSPTDYACPTEAFPKLEIRGSSTLTVPSSPKMRLPDIRQAVARLRAGNIQLSQLSVGDMGMADRLALVTALGAPARGSTRLEVLTSDQLTRLPLGDYTFSRLALRDVLTIPPRIDLPATDPGGRIGALPGDSIFDIGTVEERDGYNGLFGQALANWGASANAVRERLFPDADRAATEWLSGQRGRAILMQLDATQPNALWLVLGPDVAFAEVASMIASARRTIAGPNGQMSVLGHDNIWRNWADTRRMPQLQEQITIANFRPILGNYASWRPVYFAAILFGMALVFAAIALRLVVLTRRND